MGDHLLKNTIKVERAKQNMTQADLALKVGVSRKTINTIETGRFIPTTVTAIRIARAFGLGVEEIFTLED
ncbi:MAG: helix-turn-helix transcriptional regulator [Roseivirga sp.]|nr:helix-turn-helix transcriptional regulator [Roseivirga sp.]